MCGSWALTPAASAPTLPSYNPDLDSDPFGEDGSLWSFNYFFYNKRLKRVVFFSCRSIRLALSTSLPSACCVTHPTPDLSSLDILPGVSSRLGQAVLKLSPLSPPPPADPPTLPRRQVMNWTWSWGRRMRRVEAVMVALRSPAPWKTGVSWLPGAWGGQPRVGPFSWSCSVHSSRLTVYPPPRVPVICM